MLKIVYIPLDERPCNTDYPLNAAEVAKELTIVMPSKKIMGQKKQPGNIDALREFVLEESRDADAAVLSAEMLFYGGLLPSRLHFLNESALEEYRMLIQEIKERNPDLTLYVSNLIMRTPSSSSSDEEPDYYGKYGAEIFQYGWLKDKKQREGISEEEEKRLTDLTFFIPKEYVEDYEKRRHFNVKVNLLNSSLVKEGLVECLVIPQDDAAEYGYTAMDQRKVLQSIRELDSGEIMIYPGADEVGFTLLARAYNEQKGNRPKVYPIYSSTWGPFIVPLYEDRPISETMKAHIMACGCELASSAEDADMILAYNTPGKKMQESWEQENNQDVTYSTFRHLPTFVRKIEKMIEKGFLVVIADSAYSNGGDGELIRLLGKKGLLEKITSYKAWNTNGNTLGSTLAAGVLALSNPSKNKLKNNLLLHIYEDFIYQSIVRMEVTQEELPDKGLNYFDLKGKKEEVRSLVKEKMQEERRKRLSHSFKKMDDASLSIDFPWNRMFEITCRIEKTETKE